MRSLCLLAIVACLGALHAQNFTADVRSLEQMVDEGRYLEALGLADKLIADGVRTGAVVNAGETYLYRGIAKKELGMDQDAIIDFRVASTLDNELKEPHLHVAEIYYKMTNYSSAMESVIYYLQDDPENVEGLALKSKCLLELGEHKAAKMIIQKAITKRSSDPELYYIRAAVNNALGETRLACQDAQIALRFGYEDAQNLIDSFCQDDDE